MRLFRPFLRHCSQLRLHSPHAGGLEILKYLGPGLLVTVGFIDPGNWAVNVAAGASYGYSLLWMVSLSTFMLILLAAATFWAAGTPVSELEQAGELLRPLLGPYASVIFAVALLFAGVASSVTSGMVSEPYNIRDKHSLAGVAGSLLLGLCLIWWISDPFKGLVASQMLLSVQLPITMIAQVYLTSSPKVMGKHANGPWTKPLLIALTGLVGVLNVLLCINVIAG